MGCDKLIHCYFVEEVGEVKNYDIDALRVAQCIGVEEHLDSHVDAVDYGSSKPPILLEAFRVLDLELMDVVVEFC